VAARAHLPDSVVVMDGANNIYTRSAAVIYVMKRLGGLWCLTASLFSFVPRELRDSAYAVCASLRKKIFGTTPEICPLVPARWPARFRA
jgi:predicted DCC family thiol-disulfide oxidoreductase YuxK